MAIGKTGLPLPFHSLIESIFFFVFLAFFLLFSLVFRKEGVGLIADLRGFFLLRNRTATLYSDQITSAKMRSNVFFVLQATMLISAVAFVFLLRENWWQLPFTVDFFVFVGIFIVISVFIGLKYLLYRAIGTFFLRDDMSGWIEQYFGTIKQLGLLLFIPAIVYIYFGELRNVAYIMTVIIFFISRVAVIVGLLNIFVKNKIGFFYFIVYLCGTEIAPYILYFKGVFLLINTVGNIII